MPEYRACAREQASRATEMRSSRPAFIRIRIDPPRNCREHCRTEDPGIPQSRGDADQDRSRAESRESQPMPKMAAPVSISHPRHRSPAIGSCLQRRRRLLQHEPECDPGNSDGTRHDEKQCRVEITEHIEKPEDDAAIGHLGDRESRAEQRARTEGCCESGLHAATPEQVTHHEHGCDPCGHEGEHRRERAPRKPAEAANAVAARATLPTRVPKPTRKPATSRSGVVPVCMRGGPEETA